MLEDLTIRNLAVIESAQIRPATALTVVSGTTGGGKSLIIQALKLLRGEKGTAALVRTGADRLVVDGSFRLASGESSRAVRELLVELLGEEPEEDLLILTRTVDASGRSRAYISGRPVTITNLRRVAAFLIEIHGQGESAMHFRPASQAEMLDHFGDLTGRREEFAAALDEARSLSRALQDRARNEKETADRIDLLSFQLGEIRALDPQPGELGRLEEEASLLANLERLRELLGGAAQELSERDESLLRRLGRVRGDIEAAGALDRHSGQALADLEEAEERLRQADSAILSRLHSLDGDPGRLQEVEDRLHQLRTMTARFGVDEEGLALLAGEMARELEQLEDFDRDGEELAARLGASLAKAGRLGRDLVRHRRRVARELCRQVEKDLADLGMKEARIQVRVGEAEDGELLQRASPSGPGPVDLLLQANPGEAVRPLIEVASGGERARVMLALKRLLADADTVPLLVLDEIDAEVGGRLGGAIGRKLTGVAERHQVVCVTHLPQVAAYGNTHILVEKVVEGERTFARIREVVGEDRDRELAAMSRGEKVGRREIQQARKLRQEAAGGE